MYKSYNFVDKNPVIYRLQTIIDGHRLSLQEIAEESGLTLGCLRAIFYGKTKDPRHSTIARIVIALGAWDFPVTTKATSSKGKLRVVA
jgi:predicted transcriptional regulator